jgi:hypothetical protein
LLVYSDAHIIDVYQQRYRGLAEYYKYAADRGQLGKLNYVMETALTKTLANKYKTSIACIYRRYKGTRTVDGYTYKTLGVKVATSKGERYVYWGAVPLKVVKPGTEAIDDKRYQERIRAGTSDLVRRLQADRCELCGSPEDCQVHHVRKLADLEQRWRGRREKPLWVTRMVAMHRKTLVVCHECHLAIHAGRRIPS